MSITKIIEKLVSDSERNRLNMIDGTPIFGSPLVGFADGDDSLFRNYKKIIGAFHFEPREILKKHFPEWDDQEDSCSVICWALPIAERTKKSNGSQSTYPSERWAHTKLYGEEFNQHLRRTLVDYLREQGSLAVAPALSPYFKTRYSPRIASSWSERHALFAAGLGTFGLSDGFITLKGMAMRCGSAVTNLKLKPTPRQYRSHLENCPFFTTGKCGVCIDRCPVGAIDESGHDKARCRKFCNGAASDFVLENYGVKTQCCGLCQTGVPCESRIPG